MYYIKGYLLLFIVIMLQSTVLIGQSNPLKFYRYEKVPTEYLKIIDKTDISSIYKSGAVDISKLFSQPYSPKKNTQIIQSQIDLYKRIILPDFTLMIADEGLALPTGSVLIFQPNSVLKMEPTSKEKYELIRVHHVDNVKIINPTLVGDRDTHLGRKGEFGYGISILGASNIIVNNFHISGFWGDGIIVARGKDWITPSKNIVITNGVVDNNRRNGISIIGAVGLTLDKVVASNSHGTPPMFGVDIEAEINNDEVRDFKINSLVTFNNAQGGFMISLNRMSGKKIKYINIEVNNFMDVGSYHGLYVAHVNQGTSLKGSIVFNNLTLENNRIPMRNRRMNNDNFKVYLNNLTLVNPKNKNYTLKEYHRVLDPEKNIILRSK